MCYTYDGSMMLYKKKFELLRLLGRTLFEQLDWFHVMLFHLIVMAYMEMFGNCSHGNTTEFLRHSVHTYSLLQAEWQKHEMMLSSAQSCSFDVFCSSQR